MVDAAKVIAQANVDKSTAQCMQVRYSDAVAHTYPAHTLISVMHGHFAQAMQKLDDRLLEMRASTKEAAEAEERGESAPDSLLRMDALTAPVVGPWIDEQKSNWDDWVKRCLQGERWRQGIDWRCDDGEEHAVLVRDD
jgi:hypothetical protein|eukprot:SAG31_NODE_2929_length_4899_cov_1.752292_7_plen_138_part_00